MRIFHNFTMRDSFLWNGNLLMLLTCLLYISWWVSAFRKGPYQPSKLSSILLLFIFIAGVASVLLFIRGLWIPVASFSHLSISRILIGFIVLYFILLVISRSLFHRPLTSELFIMLFWAAGELCALFVLHESGRLESLATNLVLFLIILSTVTGFICYLKYYKLSGIASFIDGVIPLASDAVVIFVFLLIHLLSVL